MQGYACLEVCTGLGKAWVW